MIRTMSTASAVWAVPATSAIPFPLAPLAREPLQCRHLAMVLHHRHRGDAAKGGARRHIVHQPALCRQPGAIAHAEMPGEAALAADHHEIDEPGRAGDAGLRRDDAAATDAH